MRDAIASGLCLPSRQTKNGPDLYNELTQREYDYTIKGQQNLESKKDMKEKGGKSPNIADALSLTFYEELPLENSVEMYYIPPKTQADYNPLETDW